MYSVEYLAALNTLSVFIEDEICQERFTRLSLQGDNSLLIKLSSNQVLVKLPIEITQLSKITRIQQGDKKLTIKISLGSKTNDSVGAITESFMRFTTDTENQKWSCKDLKNKTPEQDGTNIFKMSCSKCLETIIDSEKTRKFFDLPSEFWSEMMDFWHCHKPNAKENDRIRNYYNGNLKAKDGEVIIGGYYFLTNDRSMLTWVGNLVKCLKCDALLGVKEGTNSKLFKWALFLRYGLRQESFSPYLYIYNMLLDKINLSATRKFVINNIQEKKSLYLWVLNVGVDMATEGCILKDSLKILYLSNSMESDKEEKIEDIEVDDYIYEDLKNELEGVNNLLPVSNRNVVLPNYEEKKFRVSYLASSN